MRAPPGDAVRHHPPPPPDAADDHLRRPRRKKRRGEDRPSPRARCRWADASRLGDRRGSPRPALDASASSRSAPRAEATVLALAEGVLATGCASRWVEGQTVALEVRWGDGRVAEFPRIASELIGLPRGVIVTCGPQGVDGAAAADAVPIVSPSFTSRWRWLRPDLRGRRRHHRAGVPDPFAGTAPELAGAVLPAYDASMLLTPPAAARAACGPWKPRHSASV